MVTITITVERPLGFARRDTSICADVLPDQLTEALSIVVEHTDGSVAEGLMRILLGGMDRAILRKHKRVSEDD